MAKFNIIFIRITTQTFEKTITAKDADVAWEKAQAMIDEGKLPQKGWEDDTEEIEINDVTAE